MSRRCAWPWYLVIGLLASVMGALASGAAELPRVTPVPESFTRDWKLAPFYKKHIDLDGFPILASDQVHDAALLEAAYLVRQMLAERPEILPAMARNRVRLVVMGHRELTTQVPEHSDLKPAKYWDRRARGLGATPARPAVSCGEENLLGFPGDPYSTENILIHEFGHAIHEMGMRSVEPKFDARLRQAYEQALAEGLWKGTYAATYVTEYWAEGVQSWFDCNRENDAQHNDINTRDEIKRYDPRLSALLAEVFGDRAWRYQRPADRPASARTHLADYDPTKAPRFAWPAELLAWNKEYEKRQAAEDRDAVELTVVREDISAVPASKAGNRATTITFTNQTDQAVKLWWVDPQGMRKPYGVLAAGARRRQDTFAGHTWLMTDSQERPLGYVLADDEPGRATITKNNRP